MTGRRARLRVEMARRFYRLSQFFGCYFHQDFGVVHGAVEDARAAAIAGHSVELRQQVRRELRAVMDEYPDPKVLAAVLDGLGVSFYSTEPGWARVFAEMVERELLASIKAHFERGTSESGA
jgi:hypothetical protein